VDLHGVVFAWGLNQMRQTGISDVADGKNVQITSPTPVDALYPDKHGGARVIEIAGGEHHTLFLLDNGEVWVCGRSGADRLGLAADHPLVVDHNAEVDAFEGEETDRPRRDDFLVPEPIRLAFPPPSTPSHTAPELSPYAQGFSATRIAHISAGERYSLAVDESGVLYAWGEGNASQLGLGQVTNARTPTRVLNTALKAHQVTAVSAGGQHCLLL
jgi:regulator of chromosome condensation